MIVSCDVADRQLLFCIFICPARLSLFVVLGLIREDFSCLADEVVDHCVSFGLATLNTYLLKFLVDVSYPLVCELLHFCTFKIGIFKHFN